MPINYNESNNYAGLLPLLLAPLAFVTPNRWQRRSAWFLFALIILAMGVVYNWPIIFQLALAIPGMRLVLNHRLLFAVQFALALLAALGMEGFIQSLPTRRRRLTLVLIGSLLVWAVLGVLVPAVFAHSYFQVPADSALAGSVWQEALIRVAILLSLGSLLLALVLCFWQNRPGLTRILLYALPVMLLIELWQAHADYLPTVAQANYFPTTNASAFLQSQPGIFRVLGGGFQFLVNTNLVYGYADLRGYDAVEPQLYYQLVFSPVIKKNSDSRLIASPLLNLLNVRYLLLPPGASLDADNGSNDPWFKRVLDGGSTQASIYENQHVLPRAWITHRVEIQPDPAARVRRLADPSFDPASTVLLDTPLPANLKLPATASVPETDTVTITRYAPETVDITTSSSSPGILVLSDQVFPGWQAQIDNVPSSIITVDHALRGLYLEAGVHHVRFTYQPQSFSLGVILTSGGVALTGFLFVWPYGRRKRGSG